MPRSVLALLSIMYRLESTTASARSKDSCCPATAVKVSRPIATDSCATRRKALYSSSVLKRWGFYVVWLCKEGLVR